MIEESKDDPEIVEQRQRPTDSEEEKSLIES